MILLFRDSSVNYWLNNTVVDCGNTNQSNQSNQSKLSQSSNENDLEIDFLMLENNIEENNLKKNNLKKNNFTPLKI